MVAKRSGGARSASKLSSPSKNQNPESARGVSVSGPPVLRGAVSSPHRRLLSGPAVTAEKYGAYIRGGGPIGTLRIWLATVSAWLDCSGEHDEESAALIVEFTAQQRAAAITLDASIRKIVCDAMFASKNRFQQWKDDDNVQSWVSFVQSIGVLETLLKSIVATRKQPDPKTSEAAGIDVKEDLLTMPEAIGNERASIVPGIHARKKTKTPRKEPVFAVPGTTVPKEFRANCREDGLPCGPLEGTASAIWNAVSPKRTGAENRAKNNGRQFLRKMHTRKGIFVRQLSASVNSVEAFVIGMDNYHLVISRHPELNPSNNAPTNRPETTG